MSDDALNEDESNALLRDLENRARKPSAAAAVDDDEDIEAFLKSLESEDAPARPTKVAEKPAPKPVPVKEAPKAEVVVVKKENAKTPKAEIKDEPKTPTETSKSKETGEPKASKKGIVLKALGKTAVILVPTMALWWLLGAYLSQWISAWWLVLTLASLVTISIPIALKVLAKRGQMGWWFAGTSLALTLLLTLPLPSNAATALGSYGHWPSTSLEASGAVGADSVVSSVSQWLSLKVAQLLAPGEYAAFRLGTDTPLHTPPVDPGVDTVPVVVPPTTPEVKTPDTTPPVTTPVTTPEVKTPDTTPPVTTPEVTTPTVEPPTTVPPPPTAP